jgi:hypothetical protein
LNDIALELFIIILLGSDFISQAVASALLSVIKSFGTTVIYGVHFTQD